MATHFDAVGALLDALPVRGRGAVLHHRVVHVVLHDGQPAVVEGRVPAQVHARRRDERADEKQRRRRRLRRVGEHARRFPPFLLLERAAGAQRRERVVAILLRGEHGHPLAPAHVVAATDHELGVLGAGAEADHGVAVVRDGLGKAPAGRGQRRTHVAVAVVALLSLAPVRHVGHVADFVVDDGPAALVHGLVPFPHDVRRALFLDPAASRRLRGGWGRK